MIKDIHYRVTTEDEWYCDDDDYDCATYELTWVDYRYTTIYTYEYWSADGRFATTNKEKISSKKTGTSRSGVKEAIKEVEKEILKELHTSEHQACEDSHYKL